MGSGQSSEVQALQGSTKFTKEELDAMLAEFKAKDSDGSGELNLAEFTAVFRSKNPDATDTTIAQMFGFFDADGSGHVSFKELATAFNSMSTMTVEGKLEFMFNIYDTDGSGTLTNAELREIITQMTRVAKTLGRQEAAADSFIAGLIARLDADADGSITKAEWVSRGSTIPSLLVLLNAGDY